MNLNMTGVMSHNFNTLFDPYPCIYVCLCVLCMWLQACFIYELLFLNCFLLEFALIGERHLYGGDGLLTS
jgi:hypothetical protein